MSFAFKIDKALKANLYKICRLCGIDREEKVIILDAEATDDQQLIDCDDELKLHQKIIQCIGITVGKDDKMPQSACILCVDKINDFYEFREMCYATDVQTRNLLGLKRETQKKNTIADIKPIIDIKEETVVKRGRKRKSDEVISKEIVAEVKSESAQTPISNKKQRLVELPTEIKKKGKLGKQIDKTTKSLDKTVKPKEEIKEEPADIPKLSTTTTTNIIVPKFRQVCNICDQRFGSKAKLEQHVAATHLPHIPRYVCTACNETIKKTNDIKSHQLWHKLSKTPYMCGHCGQSLISSYAYSRHLRDHTVEIPPNLWVLDRECPQCHQTFLTNFLYNTHLCAVRTKKCAGCNRQLRNEVEYQRHTAHCAKVYLNYSKHIPAAVAAAESTIRIKNENDVEAAAAEVLARTAGISLDMTPVVSLTRISTPEIIAAGQGGNIAEYNNESVVVQVDDAKTPGKKGSKKGVSRKDLKRVDNLLKSTLDALVSIKHEPEVHVETDAETPTTADEPANKEKESEVAEDEHFHIGDDFHYDNDDDDEEEENRDKETPSSIHICNVVIKQEPFVENATPAAAVNIKQEVIDVDNENMAPATKMPVLKLKIKKEHGTLNSSIVEEQSVRVEKKKKKKKRKEVERKGDKLLDGNEHTQENPAVQETTEVAGENPAHSNVLRPIKQERLDEADEEAEANRAESSETMQTGATVMTTIPIPQFQISAISSGVEFGENTTAAVEEETVAETSETAAINTTQVTMEDDEMPDIKPNKAELDRLFQITSVSSGVQMDQETECSADDTTTPSTTKNIEPEHTIEEQTASVGDGEVVHRKTPKNATKTFKHKASEQKARPSTQARAAKAFKSTAGISKTNVATTASGNERNIVDFTQIQIKPEPVDHGYEDVFNAHQAATNPAEAQAGQHNDNLSARDIAEQEYVNNIDFTNIQIKQEKDLDVSDVELTNTHIVANVIPNGMKRSNGEESQYSDNPDDTDSLDNEYTEDEDDDDEGEDDDNDDDDNGDDDWVGVKKEEVEKREYRELEMPPLLSTEVQETPEKSQVDADKLASDLDSDNFECTVGGDMNGIVANEQTTNMIPTADMPKSTDAELPPPFMITAIYSQADYNVRESNQFPTTIEDAASQFETEYCDAEVQPPALKIASVIAGCSASFDDLPKHVDQEQMDDNLPTALADEAMEVGNDLLPSTLHENMPEEEMGELLPTPAQNDMSEEAMDITPAVETMNLEVNQAKTVLLDAQPFSDSVAEPVNAVNTSQLITNLNASIPMDIAIHSIAENVVEEAQNALNHEVVEAQTIQRLTLTVTEATQNVEETENLMNESVAQAQLQQQQANQIETQQAESGVLLRLNDSLAEKCCSSGSSSSGSIGGGSNSGVGASANIGRSSQNTMINSHPFMLDDSNINEIAENNNNANIERELQDDVASTSAVNTSAANLTANTAEEPSNAEVFETKTNDIT